MKIANNPVCLSVLPAAAVVLGLLGGEATAWAVTPNNPKCIILSPPTNNIPVTNSSVTIKGKTHDNVAVTDVYYKLGATTNWTAVGASGTTNAFTNWSVVVSNLAAGSNTIKLYAVNSANETSHTNTLSVFYKVRAPLQVIVNGPGKVGPYTNNQNLVIERHYTMTAYPEAGCKFTGWNITTNASTNLVFTMETNLCIIATFKDVTKPTVSIKSPTANEHFTNAGITVTGKASDNVGVAAVYYQLDGGAWTLAQTQNGWAKWSVGVTLSPGPNTVRAYAVDTCGNRSLTNSVNFSFTPIQVSVSTNSPRPLTPLTLTTAGITTDDPISVTFSSKTGFSYSTTPIRVETNGTVIVAVPLYVDPNTSMVTNGTVSLALYQGNHVSAPVSISIQNLPPISTYGTKLGQITHSFYIFQEILLGRQLNELEAAQLIVTNVDTSQVQATMSNLLHGAILARSDVDRIMADSSTVITNGFLTNGAPILFDQNALDMMDRVLAVHLTGLAKAVGLTSSSARLARQSGTERDAASASTLTLNEILELIETINGEAEIVKATQAASKSEGAFDTVHAVAEGANSFLGLALGDSARVVSAQVGGILSVVSTVQDVTYMSIDSIFIIKESCFGNGNPDVLQAAYADINNLQTKTFIDSVSTALAAEGVNMAEIGGAATAWQLAGGVACEATQYGLTVWQIVGSGADQNFYNAVLSVGSQISVYPSANQGFAQLTGMAAGGNNSGLTAPQSSLNLCCFGTNAFGIQGITDSSGHFDMFVPLDVAGTDYSTLTLNGGDFISGSAWGSEVVDLSGLDTTESKEAPALTPPPVYYTLNIGITGTGTGIVTATPTGPVYTNGTVVKLTAVPASDSRFAGWSGDASGTAKSIQITMNANESVTASFSFGAAGNETWSGTLTGTWIFDTLLTGFAVAGAFTENDTFTISFPGSLINPSGAGPGAGVFSGTESVASQDPVLSPSYSTLIPTTVSDVPLVVMSYMPQLIQLYGQDAQGNTYSLIGCQWIYGPLAADPGKTDSAASSGVELDVSSYTATSISGTWDTFDSGVNGATGTFTLMKQ